MGSHIEGWFPTQNSHTHRTQNLSIPVYGSSAPAPHFNHFTTNLIAISA